MKTRKIIPIIYILLSALLFTIAGCKKSTSTTATTDTSSLQQVTLDANDVRGASDGGMLDVNSILSQLTTKSTETLPCNIHIDSSTVVMDTIVYTITYNGLNCAGTANRSGQILVKKNVTKPWRVAGSTVLVIFKNFTVMKSFTTDTIILNGTQFFENVSGGKLGQLGTSLTSVTQRDWGAVGVTFNGGITVTWNFSRQRVFTGTQGLLKMRTSGFGSQDSYTNLVVWGTSRNANIFYDQISDFVEHWENCYWHPAAGTDFIQVPVVQTKITSTYGFDDNHQPVTGGACPTMFRVDWVVGSQSGTLFMQLYP